MADRPILFSAPMVKALLDGRKTQTRRLLTPNNTLWNGHPWTKRLKAQTWDWGKAWVDKGPSPAGNPGPYLHLPWLSGEDDQWEDTQHRIYPRVQPGDRLWVRESWLKPYAHTDAGSKAEMAGYIYRADGPEFNKTGKHQWGAEMKWRVSIHMPREASRLTLTVTDMRVQRLQDISERDAQAEGVEITVRENGARAPFRELWAKINGPESWRVNPWVIVLAFTVDQRNIDQVTA